MKNKLIELLLDTAYFFRLSNFLLIFLSYFNFNCYEIKVIRYLQIRYPEGDLPNFGFSRVIKASKRKVILMRSDLKLLISSYKYQVVEGNVLNNMIESVISTDNQSVKYLSGEDLFNIVRLSCKANGFKLDKELVDDYREKCDMSFAAKAYYYAYIEEYELAVELYASISQSKLFHLSYYVYMLSVLGRQDEIKDVFLGRDVTKINLAVSYVANRYSQLVKKDEVSIDKSILIINVLQDYGYLECKNLRVSVLFKLGRHSLVLLYKDVIFSHNKFAHASGIEYIFSVLELEGYDSAYLEAVVTTNKLLKGKSYRVLWRYLLLLASLFEKEHVASLIGKSDRIFMYNIAKEKNGGYLYNLIFGTTEDLVNSIYERFSVGYNYFNTDGQGKGTFNFVSVKNINYAYIMSSCYNEYDKDDILLCEERFLSVFERSFPTHKFVSIKRPSEDVKNNISKWYGSELEGLASQCAKIKSQRISYENILRVRKTGWLEKGEFNDFPINNKKINIGVSFGTSLLTGFRSAYNIPYSIVKLFDPDKYNLINLDYHLEDSFVSSLGLVQPNFDLKNDMLSLGNLISSLDMLICIPNNIMDAGAAYGKLTIVYDPYKRVSYWRYRDSNEYLFSSNVFLYQERFTDFNERNNDFFREVCGRLNDEL